MLVKKREVASWDEVVFVELRWGGGNERGGGTWLHTQPANHTSSAHIPESHVETCARLTFDVCAAQPQ